LVTLKKNTDFSFCLSLLLLFTTKCNIIVFTASNNGVSGNYGVVSF